MTEPICVFRRYSLMGCELSSIIRTNDIVAFHSFIEKYHNYENTTEHLEPNTDMTTYNKYFNQTIAENIICYPISNTDLMKILINNYQFIPENNFMKIFIPRMNFAMFKLFHDFFDVKKYVNQVHNIFIDACEQDHLDHIKQLLAMGFDINNLNKAKTYYHTGISHAISYRRYNIIEYLLDAGIDYKKYEADILKQCIEHRDMKMIIIFLNRGASIDILNTQSNMPTRNTMEIYHLLDSHNIELPIILNLMIGQEY